MWSIRTLPLRVKFRPYWTAFFGARNCRISPIFTSVFRLFSKNCFHDFVEMAKATPTHILAVGCQAVFEAHITFTTNVLIVRSSAVMFAPASCV